MREWEVDKVFKNVHLGKIDPPGQRSWGSNDGELKRRTDPDVEFLAMDGSRIGIEKMRTALKSRFRPIGHINGNACFDIQKSQSGKYYGIFLKKRLL